MGCGIQTGAGTVLEQLRPEFGSSLAVFGCGSIGMSAIMAARICGCRQIVAVGGNDASLALAKELGATDVINHKTVPDLKAAVQQVTGGGADCAVEDERRAPDGARRASPALHTPERSLSAETAM